MNRWLWLVALLPTACKTGSQAPDLAPIGSGLSVIGLGIVIAAALIAFGKGGR